MKDLVVKEDESTCPESHETIREGVVKIIPKMTPWTELHKELKIEEVTPISKVEECIVQLNKEMEATIVKQKEEKLKNIIVNDYVPKFLFEHIYRFLRTDGGGNHQPIRS